MSEQRQGQLITETMAALDAAIYSNDHELAPEFRGILEAFAAKLTTACCGCRFNARPDEPAIAWQFICCDEHAGTVSL